jgi:predicted aminopeptidase
VSISAFRSISRQFAFGSALLALAAATQGCGTAQYLYQAGKGQFAMANRARPLDDVIHDETTPPRIREVLSEIPRIKKWGEQQGLRATPNYREYVKLDRPAATWVVSASEPLRFVSKEWSFPLIGSFPYLGWFDLGDAKKYAVTLRTKGWDVDVRGARAYSTLGWFRDPVLSSMIPPGEEALGELVNVVLHESTHATVYIGGQSSFNESLANFVAGKMTPQYLEGTRGPDSAAEKAYLDSEKEGEAIERRFHDAYGRLDAIYTSSKPDDVKLKEKHELLAGLTHDLGFKREINNATLIQYRTYNTGTDVFERVYVACGKDWKRFLGAMGKLTARSFQESQQTHLEPVLEPIVRSGCS